MLQGCKAGMVTHCSAAAPQSQVPSLMAGCGIIAADSGSCVTLSDLYCSPDSPEPSGNWSSGPQEEGKRNYSELWWWDAGKRPQWRCPSFFAGGTELIPPEFNTSCMSMNQMKIDSSRWERDEWGRLVWRLYDEDWHWEGGYSLTKVFFEKKGLGGMKLSWKIGGPK